METVRSNIKVVAHAQYKGKWFDVANICFDCVPQNIDLVDDSEGSLGLSFGNTWTVSMNKVDSIEFSSGTTLSSC